MPRLDGPSHVASAVTTDSATCHSHPRPRPPTSPPPNPRPRPRRHLSPTSNRLARSIRSGDAVSRNGPRPRALQLQLTVPVCYRFCSSRGGRLPSCSLQGSASTCRVPGAMADDYDFEGDDGLGYDDDDDWLYVEDDYTLVVRHLHAPSLAPSTARPPHGSATPRGRASAVI